MLPPHGNGRKLRGRVQFRRPRTLPGALDGIRQAIEDSDLSASQKDALLAEADASEQALNDLLLLDGQILLRYAEINRNTDTIAEETISAFIAVTEQKQRDARARLEDAGPYS